MNPEVVIHGKTRVISQKVGDLQKKVMLSYNVTNCAVPDQIDWIEEALLRERCAVNLFCNYEKGSAGQIKNLRGPQFAHPCLRD